MRGHVHATRRLPPQCFGSRSNILFAILPLLLLAYDGIANPMKQELDPADFQGTQLWVRGGPRGGEKLTCYWIIIHARIAEGQSIASNGKNEDCKSNWSEHLDLGNFNGEVYGGEFHYTGGERFYHTWFSMVADDSLDELVADVSQDGKEHHLRLRGPLAAFQTARHKQREERKEDLRLQKQQLQVMEQLRKSDQNKNSIAELPDISGAKQFGASLRANGTNEEATARSAAAWPWWVPAFALVILVAALVANPRVVRWWNGLRETARGNPLMVASESETVQE